jgi:hypothetical protein
VLEGFTVEKFNERVAIFFTDIVDGADVGVIGWKVWSPKAQFSETEFAGTASKRGVRGISKTASKI